MVLISYVRAPTAFRALRVTGIGQGRQAESVASSWSLADARSRPPLLVQRAARVCIVPYVVLVLEHHDTPDPYGGSL